MVSQRLLGQRLPRTWTSLDGLESGATTPITDRGLGAQLAGWSETPHLDPKSIVNVDGTELCWVGEGTSRVCGSSYPRHLIVDT